MAKASREQIGGKIINWFKCNPHEKGKLVQVSFIEVQVNL